MTSEEFKEEAQALRQRMESVAHRYLDDPDEAEDAIQDTMAKLWLMRDSLHPPVTALAAVMVRNICIDRIRRRRPTVRINALNDVTDTNLELEEHQRVERMMNIIDQMPATAQTVLRLRHMEGMDTAEIARITGTTEAAIRQALSRARKAVRDKYMKTIYKEQND